MNIHPGEGQLPLNLDLEVAVYLCLIVAFFIAMILAPLVAPVTSFFIVIGTFVAGAIAHRTHFYQVTLANWPRYKAASLRFIDQIAPKF